MEKTGAWGHSFGIRFVAEGLLTFECAMKVLVFESSVGGHFLQYAGVLAAALSATGARVILAIGCNAPSSASYAHHVKALGDVVEVAPCIRDVSPNASLVKFWGARLLELRRLVDEFRPDRVYLPTADGLAQLVGPVTGIGLDRILSGVPIEALVMNGSVAHLSQAKRGLRALRDNLSYRAARSGRWERLFYLNPLVREWELEHGVSESRATRTMPEPVEASLGLGRALARSHLQLDPARKYVGMVGRLDRRKGADLLVRAFATGQWGRDVNLLLVGSASAEVVGLVEEMGKRLGDRGLITLIDREVSNYDLLAAIEAIDVMVLPYRMVIGSSGIVVRTVAAKRPVVISPGGWAEQMVKRFGIGWVLESASVEAIERSVPRALEMGESGLVVDKCRAFARYHTIHNFSAHWTSGIRDAIGIAQDPDLYSWDTLCSECLGDV